MTVCDEDSDITLRAANRDAHRNTMPPRAGIPTSFGRTREDRDISACIQKLEQKKDDTKKQIEYLSKLRGLLQQKVQQQQQVSDLGILIGPSVVDVMRNHPANEELIEECTCILYLLSILDPSFKKGVARLFKAMEDHRDNVAIQRAACAAIRRVISKNPDAIPRIVPSVGVILRSMTEHTGNAKFLCSALEVLAIIASNIPAKPIFVYRDGALNQVLTAMKKYPNDLSIQATALRTLSNLAYGSGEDILDSFGPTITVIIRAMKRHVLQNKVQLYGCCTLHYIASSYRKSITEAWAIPTILVAMKEYAHDLMLQEQGCSALAVILDAKVDEDIDQFMKDEGLTTILRSMMQSPQNVEIQKQGLKILNSLNLQI